MWKLKANFAIGGLREMGFYEDSDYLLLLSSQGRGLFDCLAGEKIARDNYDYYSEEWDPNTGIVKGIGQLSDKQIKCGGFEYADILEKEIGENLKTEIVKEKRKIWNGEVQEVDVLNIIDHGEKTEIYSTPYGLDRAFGFSKNGQCFVLGISSNLFIWTKANMIMDRYKETFETWNKVASLYQDKFMDLDLYNNTYDFICDSITKDNAKILEIGCGPGNITKYLLSKRPDFDIFGIDIAPNMIELAKNNNPTASFAIMDTRQINEIETKYDGIVCGFCLPYLSQADSRKLITDCYNLLNENGLIYISFVEGEPIKSDFQVGSSGDRSYFYFHDLYELKTKLIDSDFRELNTFKVEYKKSKTETDIHTILTAKKKASAQQQFGEMGVQ